MTDENNLFGAHKLPADPPSELDDMPYAQATWIKVVIANPGLSDSDLDSVLEFSRKVEELSQLEHMRSRTEIMRSSLEKMQMAGHSKEIEEVLDHLEESLDRMYDRIEAKKALMRRLYAQLRPGGLEIKVDRIERLIGPENKELLADSLEEALSVTGYGDVTMVVSDGEIRAVESTVSRKAKKRKK
jgi:hypothetical protein